MKILGSILILSASIVSSYLYEKKKRNEILELQEIYKLAMFIKNQISCFSTPIKEIYSKFKTDSALANKIMNGEKIFLYDKEISGKLNDCLLSLGRGYKSEQLKSLEYICAELKMAEKSAKEGYKSKISVFRSVAIFLGCCLIIFLV